MFRFVHTADVHLDSPLYSLALRAPEAADRVGTATRTAFTRTVDLCLDEKVDALVVAGDLYDGKLRSMKTARYFAEEMRRLTAAGIAAFIVRGNHDAESVITKELTLPDGVHVFKDRDAPVLQRDGAVALHGVSFANKRAPESLLPKYEPPVAGALNIGIMHTSVGGTPPHDVYAPCSLEALARQGYDYWALGHIHKRSLHLEGACTIVMPGIPQGRHINEDGPRSVSLVTFDQDRRCHVEERSVAAVRFERIALDLGGIESWADLIDKAEAAFGAFADAMEADCGVIRVELTGATPLEHSLRRDADRLIEELASAAARVGALYVEKAALRLAAPSHRDDVAGSMLAKMIADGRVDPDIIKERFAPAVTQLLQRLPSELRARFDPSDDAELLDRLIQQGTDELVGLLRAGQVDDAP